MRPGHNIVTFECKCSKGWQIIREFVGVTPESLPEVYDELKRLVEGNENEEFRFWFENLSS